MPVCHTSRCCHQMSYFVLTTVQKPEFSDFGSQNQKMFEIEKWLQPVINYQVINHVNYIFRILNISETLWLIVLVLMLPEHNNADNAGLNNQTWLGHGAIWKKLHKPQKKMLQSKATSLV